MSDARYPIGKFEFHNAPSPEERAILINHIAETPAKLRSAIQGLTSQQMETPYREGGWTVRQVAHHVPESHMNAYIRFKLALTEDEPPTIRPYYEDRWAELGDSKLPVNISLHLIESLHARWAAMLESMSDADFNKTFLHPETGPWTLDGALALYAWHSKHHTAHITRLRERNGWVTENDEWRVMNDDS